MPLSVSIQLINDSSALHTCCFSIVNITISTLVPVKSLVVNLTSGWQKEQTLTLCYSEGKVMEEEVLLVCLLGHGTQLWIIRYCWFIWNYLVSLHTFWTHFAFILYMYLWYLLILCPPFRGRWGGFTLVRNLLFLVSYFLL